MTEDTRRDARGASETTSGASGARRKWTEDEMRAEEVRAAGIMAAIFGEGGIGLTEFSRNVAATLVRLEPGQLVCILEGIAGDISIGRAPVVQVVEHIRNEFDEPTASELIALVTSTPETRDHKKIVIRFRTGTIVVREARVQMVGRGGMA